MAQPKWLESIWSPQSHWFRLDSSDVCKIPGLPFGTLEISPQTLHTWLDKQIQSNAAHTNCWGLGPLSNYSALYSLEIKQGEKTSKLTCYWTLTQIRYFMHIGSLHGWISDNCFVYPLDWHESSLHTHISCGPRATSENPGSCSYIALLGSWMEVTIHAKTHTVSSLICIQSKPPVTIHK